MSCVHHVTNHCLNVSSDIEKKLITMHGPSSLFMSTASGEREDALPQTPECTNSTGLFEEAAGKDQSKHTLKLLFCHTFDWNKFEPTFS